MKLLFPYNILLFLFIGFTTTSQVFRQSKSIFKTFEIEKATELTIKNKYGNIQLVNWPKDSVKFEITIEVRNKKKSKALATLNDIYIDFVTTKHFLEARTSSIDSESFWYHIKNKTSDIFSSENKIQINYKVFLPVGIAINIENKFGDILLDDQQASSKITLSNGDLKAYSFMGGVSLNLEYAYANIKKMTDGKFHLGYKSEIQLGTANNIQITSKSSRINIESVEKLDIQSHRDKYYIKNVGFFNAKSSYSYLNIDMLDNNLNMEANYGNIDIKEIHESVTSLHFNLESTDLNLIEPANRNIIFKLIYNEKTGLFFPEKLKNKITVKKDNEKKLVETTGQLGSTEANTLTVSATLIEGNIRVEAR